MNLGGPFHDYRVPLAVLSCIAENGIETTDLATVAARLHRSRSTIYRQFGSKQQLLAYTHARTLATIASLFDSQRTGRRREFEEWWTRLLGFLRGPLGRPFRALRLRLLADGLEDDELAQLPGLIEWIGLGAFGPDVVARARAVWAMALSASTCTPGEEEEHAMRELVWSAVAVPGAASASPAVDSP